MVIETGETGENVQQDTTLHAVPFSVGEYGDPGDRLIIPGLGIYLSKHAIAEFERDGEKTAKEYEVKNGESARSIRGSLSRSMVIREEQLRAWVNALDKYHAMDEAAKKAKLAKDVHEHEEECYPGTDTRDPLKYDGKFRRNRNEFNIDRSESTISLHIASCTGKYLNNSTIKHHRFITIHLTTPDGRSYGTVALTFDQFASALVSNSATPCTWEEYWGINSDSVRLREVVKEPDTISDRMESRLNDRLKEIEDRFANIDAQLAERIDSGKAMSKTALAELRRELSIAVDHLSANRNFTVEQAREEVSSIVEQAAISVAFTHRLSAEEVLDNSHAGALIESLIKPRLIEVSEPSQKQD